MGQTHKYNYQSHNNFETGVMGASEEHVNALLQ